MHDPMTIFAVGVATGILVAYVSMRSAFKQARAEESAKIENLARERYGLLRRPGETLEQLTLKCLQASAERHGVVSDPD